MRKVLDTYPQITIAVGAVVGRHAGWASMTREQAEEAQAEFLELLDKLRAKTPRRFDITEARLVEEVRCEHCNSEWTAAGTLFNDGCCDRDSANDPDWIGVLRSLAEGIENDTFYRYEDGKRGHVRVNWPDGLGAGVAAWLAAGRPPEAVPGLLKIVAHVEETDWCTVWEDPGPSGCSLARLPDEVRPDVRPAELASELLSLIDDMGLLPVRKAA